MINIGVKCQKCRKKKSPQRSRKTRKKNCIRRIVHENGYTQRIKSGIRRELYIDPDYFDKKMMRFTKEYILKSSDLNVEQMIKEHLINFKIPADIKTGLVQLLIRTVRRKMAKYFGEKNGKIKI